MEIKKKCARWFSRRGAIALLMALIAAMPVSAQSAKQILDKAAAVVSAKQGAQADFTINQKSYTPSQVRYRTAKGWTTIDIRNFKQTSLSDGIFRFNAKEYPNAEVIDLR